jgi:hypothetical protein
MRGERRMNDRVTKKHPSPQPSPLTGAREKQSMAAPFPASFAPLRGEGLRMRGDRRGRDYAPDREYDENGRAALLRRLRVPHLNLPRRRGNDALPKCWFYG